jgi:hypothetical protein
MDQLLALLQQSILTTQQDGAVIVENMRASRAMEADIAAAIEARVNAQQRLAEHRKFCAELDELTGHREFSCFTPDTGRP